jgi:3-dehydro-4-phosphotetronate decarboxylase
VTEASSRANLVRLAKSLFDRGLTPGSSGNVSVRLEDGFLFTPTNACLGFLEPERLSKLDAAGRHISGDPPTKELPLHFAFYEARPHARAVVHLHST